MISLAASNSAHHPEHVNLAKDFPAAYQAVLALDQVCSGGPLDPALQAQVGRASRRPRSTAAPTASTCTTRTPRAAGETEERLYLLRRGGRPPSTATTSGPPWPDRGGHTDRRRTRPRQRRGRGPQPASMPRRTPRSGVSRSPRSTSGTALPSSATRRPVGYRPNRRRHVRALGRISLPCAACSTAWVVQPTVRLTANVGVNDARGRPDEGHETPGELSRARRRRLVYRASVLEDATLDLDGPGP